MKINLTFVKVRDLVNGYMDNEEEGVKAYGGILNVRPPYQREFVYKDKQRDAVIDTISKGFPLNVMYWVKNEDGTYEVLDGQQRTLSICQYCGKIGADGRRTGDFSINERKFHNLTDAEQNAILDYELMVYVCEGDDKERLDWFRTINIAGEKLTDQELLNINYVGTWLADAKRKFSKNGCVAYRLGSKYLKGSPIRQEYLETTLDWISGGNIARYMSEHQHDENASELWEYYQSVIAWVEKAFTTYRKEMCGLNWGKLYAEYHENEYDADALETRISELMANEEVTDKKGVYEYVLSGEDETLACKLSKRPFSEKDKRTAYEKQKGIDPISREPLDKATMKAHHIKAWNFGGTTTLDNLILINDTTHHRIHEGGIPADEVRRMRDELFCEIGR